MEAFAKRSLAGGRYAALMLIGALLAVPTASAQQKIGYIDSDFILQRMSDFATIQERLDKMAQDWEKELEDKEKEVDELFKEYQARELLYTNDEKQRKRNEIVQAEQELEQLRQTYFGPQGRIFTEQDQLMRPLQEDILTAVEEVATSEGYDFVFDKNGDYVFLFAREQHDLSEKVLQELGIELDDTGRSTTPVNTDQN